jgi:NADH-quinone oxidoreductase subunit M
MTLTSLIFFPILASILLVFIKDDLRIRQFSLIAGIVEILLSIPLFGFKAHGNIFQFVEFVPWVPKWGLNYYLGIDGISLTMILLTVLLLPLCVLCSWTYIEKRIKEFHICLLLMSAVCIGVFASLDFVLFYVFWEAMLVPMFLLIAIWGGPRRKYASIKFIIYTLAGSTLLLVAMIAFYTQVKTFSIPEMMKHTYSFRFQYWAFLAMAIAFAIKVPMFPFHTWLPAAHVEAPTAGSVVLASVLLKMGTYGFLRFSLPLTPDASIYFAPLMIGFSIASIIYGGFVALGQNDMKKLIAYSSVGHMGFVTLGIFVFNLRGLEGALMQMINHGITTGALFMMVGAIYERSHSREISDNKGLGKFLPMYMGFFGLFALSSLAFPGTNSFVGEILVLIGSFTKNYWVGAMAIPGALLAATYMLRLLQKMAWGEPSSVPGWHGWKDLKIREWVYLIPLALLVLYLGLAPGLTLKTIDPSLNHTLSKISAVQQKTATIALNNK